MAIKEGGKDQAYQERKARAMALVGRQVALKKETTDQGKQQVGWSKQEFTIDDFHFSYFPTPEGDKWEIDSPIRFIDDEGEFVISLGWVNKGGKQVPDSIKKVEPLNGRTRTEYREDFLKDRDQRREQQRADTQALLEKVRSRN